MEIKKKYCGINGPLVLEEEASRETVLQGEIEGVGTSYVELSKGKSYQFVPKENTATILLITKGEVKIRQHGRQFVSNEIALFVPAAEGGVSVSAENGKLGMLEVAVKLTEKEMGGMKGRKGQFPFFVTWSQCRKYKEAIKSEKTVSRMLLPENIIPRVCMGAVETTGPDEVGEHAHPMLEQLFFGLEKNDCFVTADGAMSTFNENTLLHIPLGAVHGVKVEEGKTLNYIWMDFFRSQEDMGYIADNHLMEGG